jgi:acetyltransferase-like isoleucine patch superfamily enzyme
LNVGLLATLRAEVGDHHTAFVFGLPGRVGNRARERWFRRRAASIGGRLFIDRNCAFMGPERMSFGSDFRCGADCFFSAQGGQLSIGARVSLNRGVHLNASIAGEIAIGDDVRMGPGVILRSADHIFDDPDRLIHEQGHAGGRIQIESGVWLGANVVVVRGVTIGQGAVVGAGAVVTKDLPPYSISGGVPARQIAVRGGAMPDPG